MFAAVEFRLASHFLGAQGQRDGFVLLGSFLITFLFIRTSARLMRSPRVPWWPGSVTTSSGLHLHHLVWGIVLMLLSGFLGFVVNRAGPWDEILAAVFGIGAGLTLDEFALWVRLEDVYWTEQGRSSLDAVVIATVLGALIVLGLAPFDTADASPGLSLLAVVTIDVLLCATAILKGRLMLGLIGVFIPLTALIGAVRLASPTSPWARWRYKPGSRKLARSQARFARAAERHRRALDVIGGPPSAPAAPANDHSG